MKDLNFNLRVRPLTSIGYCTVKNEQFIPIDGTLIILKNKSGKIAVRDLKNQKESGVTEYRHLIWDTSVNINFDSILYSEKRKFVVMYNNITQKEYLNRTEIILAVADRGIKSIEKMEGKMNSDFTAYKNLEVIEFLLTSTEKEEENNGDGREF